MTPAEKAHYKQLKEYSKQATRIDAELIALKRQADGYSSELMQKRNSKSVLEEETASAKSMCKQ